MRKEAYGQSDLHIAKPDSVGLLDTSRALTSFNGTKGTSTVNQYCDANAGSMIREYEVCTDFCEGRSITLIFCHKKSASGVYSQRATNEADFLMAG